MNKIFSMMAGCCALLLSMHSHAAVRTYEFTATIDGIAEYGPPWGQQVAWMTESEGPDGGPVVRAGQHIVGRFSFDDAAVPDKSTQYGSDYVAHEYSKLSSSYSVLENGTTFSGAAFASVGDQANDPASIWDRDELVIDSYDYHWQLRFQDDTHVLFANGLPSTTLTLDQLSYNVIGAAWWRSDGSLVGFSVPLTSLTLVPVPEPETWGMLLAGLGMVGYAMRRQRG